MKKVLLLLNISLIMSTLACQKKEVEETPLPFFNTADFTPEWIDPSDRAYERIHTIDQFSFLNQQGSTITNQDLKGSIYVADFFFTICPSICPKMTSNLASIQEAFQAEEVKLLSFSVMPWADSVSVLNEYATVRGIESKQWHLLTGDTDEIYSLARQSFFAEKAIGLNKTSNEFLHTENFILVDGKGRIRGVYNGTLALEMTRLKQDIETLLRLG